MLEAKIWNIIEGLIDERIFTDLSMYKSLENKKEIKGIIADIEDLAWKIENDMRDSL